jgi:hypothetical protein
MYDVAARVLDGFLHDVPALVAVREAGGEHAAERRIQGKRSMWRSLRLCDSTSFQMRP